MNGDDTNTVKHKISRSFGNKIRGKKAGGNILCSLSTNSLILFGIRRIVRAVEGICYCVYL
jgi:hypothetical protein